MGDGGDFEDHGQVLVDFDTLAVGETEDFVFVERGVEVFYPHGINRSFIRM